MAEDWAAVAKAINERVKVLGWSQRELAERSHVSSAIIREIQRNTVNRKRSPRTLESLSIALGWQPEHLDAVLYGRKAPASRDDAVERDLSTRIDGMEQRFDTITEQLTNVQAALAKVLERLGIADARREP